MSLIEIQDLDVVFSNAPKPSLDLLDQGLSRDEIFKQTGLIVGVEKANLTVERGEICVLMGLSGSGKSSLLRCINGLNTVSRGKLLIEHEGAQVDIANCSAAQMKAMRTQRIAMVFQKFALMPWLTVAENVSLGLEMQGLPSGERKKRIDDKLELVGLSQWRDKRPDALSGGMQQRVGLARALAMDADILLMDEPFSALDPLIRQGLQDELLDLQRQLNMTIVFVSSAQQTRRHRAEPCQRLRAGFCGAHQPVERAERPQPDAPAGRMRAARWRNLPGQRGRHLAQAGWPGCSAQRTPRHRRPEFSVLGHW